MPHIIVDYTSEAEQLVHHVISLSLAIRRSINLVGLVANPEIILPRLIERHRGGKNLPAALPEYMKERHDALPG